MTRILKSIKRTDGPLETETFEIVQSLDPTENNWNQQMSNIQYLPFFLFVFLFSEKASDKTCNISCSLKQNQT